MLGDMSTSLQCPSPINLCNGCNECNKSGIWNELSKPLSYVTTHESKWFWNFCRGWLENSGGRKVAGSSPVAPTGSVNLEIKVQKNRTVTHQRCRRLMVNLQDLPKRRAKQDVCQTDEKERGFRHCFPIVRQTVVLLFSSLGYFAE